MQISVMHWPGACHDFALFAASVTVSDLSSPLSLGTYREFALSSTALHLLHVLKDDRKLQKSWKLPHDGKLYALREQREHQCGLLAALMLPLTLEVHYGQCPLRCRGPDCPKARQRISRQQGDQGRRDSTDRPAHIHCMQSSRALLLQLPPRPVPPRFVSGQCYWSIIATIMMRERFVIIDVMSHRREVGKGLSDVQEGSFL